MKNYVEKQILKKVKEYKQIGLFDDNTAEKCPYYYGNGFCSNCDNNDCVPTCVVMTIEKTCPYYEPQPTIAFLENSLKKIKRSKVVI